MPTRAKAESFCQALCTAGAARRIDALVTFRADLKHCESGKVSKSRGKTKIRLRATLDFSTFESRPPSLRAGLFFVVVTVVFW